LARGLLEDDNEWRQCLQEAAVMQTGSQLRHLFTTILHDCNPTTPLVLWNQFKENICDDLKRRLQQMGHENPTEEEVYDYGLYLIDLDLRKKGKSLEQCPPMPLPVGNWAQLHGNRLIAEQLAYDRADQRDKAQQRLGQLNAEQRAAYDAIISAIENNTPKMFFLNGPAGTGKTFLYTILSATIFEEME
jgi:primosomal protein N'